MEIQNNHFTEQTYKTISGASTSRNEEAIKAFLGQQDLSDTIETFQEFRGLITTHPALPHDARVRLDWCYCLINDLLKSIKENTQF